MPNVNKSGGKSIKLGNKCREKYCASIQTEILFPCSSYIPGL